MYLSRETIRMEQRFWKAEVRGRTVITTTDGYFCETGSAKKTYPSTAAADCAARADYAKKLRVGFVPIREAELIPLMRLVFRICVRGEGKGRLQDEARQAVEKRRLRVPLPEVLAQATQERGRS